MIPLVPTLVSFDFIRSGSVHLIDFRWFQLFFAINKTLFPINHHTLMILSGFIDCKNADCNFMIHTAQRSLLFNSPLFSLVSILDQGSFACGTYSESNDSMSFIRIVVLYFHIASHVVVITNLQINGFTLLQLIY